MDHIMKDCLLFCGPRRKLIEVNANTEKGFNSDEYKNLQKFFETVEPLIVEYFRVRLCRNTVYFEELCARLMVYSRFHSIDSSG